MTKLKTLDQLRAEKERAGRGRQPYPRPERRVCFQRRSHYRLGQSRNAGTLA